eukprot:2328693-Alexandrium_andersonii.AAC.1
MDSSTLTAAPWAANAARWATSSIEHVTHVACVCANLLQTTDALQLQPWFNHAVVPSPAAL